MIDILFSSRGSFANHIKGIQDMRLKEVESLTCEQINDSVDKIRFTYEKVLTINP